MNVLIISVEINGLFASTRLTAVHNSIKTSHSWWHHLKSTWIIVDQRGAEYWSGRLRQHLDEDDKLLVIRADINEIQGWLPEKAWTWLQTKFGA